MRTIERPLRGIVGVLTPEASLDAIPEGLGGVELRADLWPDANAALTALHACVARWPVLFTLRLAEEGGTFRGDERSRAGVFREALARGASLVDVELGSACARDLAAEGAPLVLSRHDFDGMPDEDTLASWTHEALALEPYAVKIIPTAASLADACRMLRWVGESPADGPRRLGFAMGERGLASRVLSIAFGAPYTYASLAASVAPGQVPAGELIERYRAASLTRESLVFGVVGNPVAHSRSPHLHNPALQDAGVDAVYLPLLLDRLGEIDALRGRVALRGLSVTIPFKREAFEHADVRDRRSEAAGASNTLRFREDGTVEAFNTDFDGVLGPLRSHLGETLQGLDVAVLGAGGAARGAVAALAEVGARATIYCRSLERGKPVADALGVEVRTLDALEPGSHRVVLNATSLGLRRDDPSPVDPRVFASDTVAFDMIYEPAETQFLRDAASRGARTIRGREMLIAQGLVQFRIFTGRDADPAIFAAGLDTGR